MTDLATALATTFATNLADFEGKPVRRSAVEIPGAAGGLREAMSIDPREFHQGEEIFVVIKCEVQKVRFDPIDKNDPSGDQKRIHILKAEEAAFIDEELVGPTLREQKERIQRARDEARGQLRLPTDEELLRAHELGEHAEALVDGCVECDKEAAAVAEEEREHAASTRAAPAKKAAKAAKARSRSRR